MAAKVIIFPDEMNFDQSGALSLVLVLYGIRAPIVGPFRAWKPPIPYAIKNQREASKIPSNGGILRSKAPSRVLWMPELVLYGIRELA